MSEGKFIVIEGPDGAGSSTQIALAKKYFEDKGKRVLVTKEPTDNVVGGIIRGVLTKQIKFNSYGLQLLFSADRAQHLELVIGPALKDGWYVLTDRYCPSTLVYADKDYWNVLMHVNKQFRIPDVTILLDLDPGVCIERIKGSRLSTELFETEEKLSAVVNGYRRFANEYQNAVLLNAHGSIDEVHNRIKDTIETRLYQK